jgi:hypothetical protein
VYIPPDRSRYSTLEFFYSFEISIVEIHSLYDNASFCIVSDFNARSDILSDFTDFENYTVKDNFRDDITDALNRNNLLDLGFPAYLAMLSIMFYFRVKIFQE